MTDIRRPNKNFHTISESPEVHHQGVSPDRYNRPQSKPLENHNGELLIMTVEIGNGRKDTIHVFERDEPEELAIAFCARHNLNPTIVFPLSQNILSNMEQVLRERVELLRQYNGSPSYDTRNAQNKHSPARKLQEDPAMHQSREQSKWSPFNRKSSGSLDRNPPRSASYGRSKTPEAHLNRVGNENFANQMQYYEEQMNRQERGQEYNANDENEALHKIMDKSMNKSRDEHHNPELTFTPKINDLSKVLVENKFQHNQMSVYDRLHNKPMFRRKTESQLNRSQLERSYLSTKPHQQSRLSNTCISSPRFETL